MGYTHGTLWTEEKIIKGILEVCEKTELDRMPTRSEIKSYYNNDKLTNAIRRSGGLYEYARLLDLPIKMNETYFGKKHETKAADILNSKGFEVRKMPQNFAYDLLVEDSVKIDVKASNLYCGKQGNFYSANLEKPYTTCDIYILFLLNRDGSVKDILIIPSKFVALHTQISVGQNRSKYYKYSERWDYVNAYVDFLENIS